MPKPYNAPLGSGNAPCPYCRSTARYIRDKGPHIGICCPEGHFTANPMWLSTDDFRDGGEYFGVLPPEDFDKARRRRSKKFQIIEHIRVAVCQERKCYLCRKARFDGPRTSGSVLAWLKAERAPLYYRVLQHFSTGGSDALARLPADWSKKMPEILRDEVLQELDFSQIECDHLVPVMFLELLEKNTDTIQKQILEFGGRRLGVPLCQRCNRGRHLHIEAPERLLDRWVNYKFNGNRLAAQNSAEWPWSWIELLVRRAAAIQRDLLKIKHG